MLPNITISTVDLSRIDLLLDRLPSKHPFDVAALSNELARATIVEPWEISPRIVTMNSTVRFELQGLEGELCRTLGYPKDAAHHDQHLSVLTPVGSALLGLSEGDSISWVQQNGKTVEIRVLEVLYQPERLGIYHL